jgi:hypothetical protein
VRQKEDCTRENAAWAVRIRWCEQDPKRECLDTGCREKRGGECKFVVRTPPAVRLEAKAPRNELCGRRWACTVRVTPPSLYECTSRCTRPEEEVSRARPEPLITLAPGTYTVVAVWPDGFCPGGRIEVGAYDGKTFRLKAKGKCLPPGLEMEARFGQRGGAFFASGSSPSVAGLYYLSGVVDDPDSFYGLLTSEANPKEAVQLTGRRMTTSR